MGRMIALAAALAGALLLGWLGTRTPGPEPVSAAPVATAFQTDLAMVDINRIARTAHPAGSAANASVRDYLLGRMTALGLQPTVQSGMAVNSTARSGGWILAGQMQNIVGVLPGKDRSAPAIALMAHYDSVPASPGAADDATGAAVVLDVFRAMEAKGTPERDVIVILTDGEEAGLLGAHLFFAEHPLRKHIGMLINLESRGGGGRANMFQTGTGNGALIPIFAKTAVQPISNSLAVFLYERMPNDTDFTVSKDLGIRGLNFAFIGRQFDYHSPTSTLPNLDRGSVTSMGVQTLAAASALAFAETLPAAVPDVVYSQTFGDHLLAYPAWAGWIPLLLAAGLIGLAAMRGRRDETFVLIDAARGAGAALFLLLAGALLLYLARRATGVEFGFMGQRPLLAQWPLWETTMAALGLGLLLLVPNLLARERVRLWLVGAGLAGGLLCLAFAGWDPIGLGLGVATALVGYLAFGKPAALPGAWLGLLLSGLVVGVGLQIALPAVAFLVSWPLVLAGLAAAASLMGTRTDLSRTTGLVLLAALGGGWLMVFFHVVSQGLDRAEILTLFLWLGAFLLWPLAWPGRMPRLSLAPAVSFLLLGVVLLAVVRFSDPWSTRYPQATTVFHILDIDTGKTLLASTETKLAPWTRKVLESEGGKISKQDLRPFGRRLSWAAPARPEAIGKPQVVAYKLPDGRIGVRTPPMRVVALDIRATTAIGRVHVDGAESTLKAEPGEWVHIRLVGAPVVHEVSISPAGPGSLEVRFATVEESWPTRSRPLPPRPSDVMPFDLSDSRVFTGKTTLSW